MKQIEAQICKMVDCSYQYKNNVVTIIDYKISDGRVKLFINDNKVIEFPIVDAVSQLSQFTPAPQLARLHNNSVIVEVLQSSGSVYDTVQKTLLDSIEKIKKDADYIPQAEAINSTVAKLIDIEKTRIAGLSLLKN